MTDFDSTNPTHQRLVEIVAALLTQNNNNKTVAAARLATILASTGNSALQSIGNPYPARTILALTDESKRNLLKNNPYWEIIVTLEDVTLQRIELALDARQGAAAYKAKKTPSGNDYLDFTQLADWLQKQKDAVARAASRLSEAQRKFSEMEQRFVTTPVSEYDRNRTVDQVLAAAYSKTSLSGETLAYLPILLERTGYSVENEGAAEEFYLCLMRGLKAGRPKNSVAQLSAATPNDNIVPLIKGQVLRDAVEKLLSSKKPENEQFYEPVAGLLELLLIHAYQTTTDFTVRLAEREQQRPEAKNEKKIYNKRPLSPEAIGQINTLIQQSYKTPKALAQALDYEALSQKFPNRMRTNLSLDIVLENNDALFPKERAGTIEILLEDLSGKTMPTEQEIQAFHESFEHLKKLYDVGCGTRTALNNHLKQKAEQENRDLLSLYLRSGNFNFDRDFSNANTLHPHLFRELSETVTELVASAQEKREKIAEIKKANDQPNLSAFCKSQFGVDPFYLYLVLHGGQKGQRFNAKFANEERDVLIQSHGEDFKAWAHKAEETFLLAFDPLCQALDTGFQSLSAKEKSILFLYNGVGFNDDTQKYYPSQRQTQEAISKDTNVSDAAISIIKQKALRKLLSPYNSTELLFPQDEENKLILPSGTFKSLFLANDERKDIGETIRFYAGMAALAPQSSALEPLWRAYCHPTFEKIARVISKNPWDFYRGELNTHPNPFDFRFNPKGQNPDDYLSPENIKEILTEAPGFLACVQEASSCFHLQNPGQNALIVSYQKPEEATNETKGSETYFVIHTKEPLTATDASIINTVPGFTHVCYQATEEDLKNPPTVLFKEDLPVFEAIKEALGQQRG
jgi:hypothetical protein